MNIPTLNTVLLATPKSNIEQSVGRILRQKKEERAVQPMILDVLDAVFPECSGQWNKRRKFYKECGYTIQWAGAAAAKAEEDAAEESGEARVGGGSAAAAATRGVPLFVEEE